MEPIFEAVLKGEREVARLLRNDPAVARTRAAQDHLVEAIPHWVYGGDTSLHLAAAELQQLRAWLAPLPPQQPIQVLVVAPAGADAYGTAELQT